VGVILNDGGLYGDGTSAPLWHGQSVTSTDVLVAFTYAGDADLNGLIDGIDYALTDNGFNSNLSGWFNGDFDYNGVVNGDDYFVLDSNLGRQGAAFPTSGGVAGDSALALADEGFKGGVSVVPEPASIGLMSLGAIGLLGRRSRRRKI